MTVRLQPKTTRGRRGLLSSEDIVANTKKYTNPHDRPMRLVEVAKSRITKAGIEVRHSEPPHGHPVKAGESVMLSRGVRRVWREI